MINDAISSKKGHADTVCATIARLLAWLPDPTLQAEILRDWIQLALDLSILWNQQEVWSKQQQEPVEILLFDSVVVASGQTEYVLRVPDRAAILSLQCGSLAVLEHFLRLRKEKRLRPAWCSSVMSLVEEEFASSHTTTSGFVDLEYYEVDADTMQEMLACLRQVLLSPEPKDSTERVLYLRTKIRAAGLLYSLQTDLDRIGRETSPLCIPTALLVSQAAIQHARGSFQTAGQVELSCARKVAACLVQAANSANNRQEQQAILTTLLDSLPVIETSCHPSDWLPARKRPLEVAILHAVHVLLCRRENVGGELDPLLVEQETLQHVVRLTGEPAFHDNATWILSSLLQNWTRLSELEDLCTNVPSTLREQQVQGNKGGSKRQRPTDDEPHPKKRVKPDSEPAEMHAIQNATVDLDWDWSMFSARGCYCTKSFLLDALGLFLCRAAQSSQLLLDTELSGTNSGKLAFVANVTSALGLLISMVEAVSPLEAFGSSPSLVSLTHTLTASLSKCAQAVGSAEQSTEKEIETQLLVSFGLRVTSTPSAVLDALLEPDARANFMLSIRDLIFQSGDGNLSSQIVPDLPMWALGVLYHGGLHIRLPSRCGDSVTAHVAEFGPVSISAHASFSEGLSFLAKWVGTLFVLPDLSECSQTRRLHLLAGRLGRSDSVSAGISLQQQTCDVLKAINIQQTEGYERLIAWQCVGWLITVSSPQDLQRLFVCGGVSDDSHAGSTNGLALVHFLFDTSFSDNCSVRDYVSRELGNVLHMNGWSGLLSLLSDNGEWEALKETSDGSPGLRTLSTLETLALRLFQYVDHLLHKHCSVPQSHLSLTVADSSSKSKDSFSTAVDKSSIATFQKAAVRSLLSLCQDSEASFGRIVYEQSLKRVVRLWNGTGIARRESEWMCFGEMSRLCLFTNVPHAVGRRDMPSFIPALFREVLLPSSSGSPPHPGIENISRGAKEQQCTLLSAFMSLLMDTGRRRERFVVSLRYVDVADLQRYLEPFLPHILAQFIIDKDYDSLRLTTNYKLFLLSQKRFEDKRRDRGRISAGLGKTHSTDVVVGPHSSFLDSSFVSRAFAVDLEDQTGLLCHAPHLFPDLLPLVLARAGHTEMLFLTSVVLQGRLKLNCMIEKSQTPVLKALIWEVGRTCPGMSAPAIRALRIAASARREELASLTNEIFEQLPLGLPGFNVYDVAKGYPSVIEWVNAEFMYLLVNLVQAGWRARGDGKRAQAMRCLVFMLGLLKPSESSQYFPQISASFNAAVSPSDEFPTCEAAEVKWLAVRALAIYVRLLANHQSDFLGRNLNVVVVSLLPIVVDPMRSGEDDQYFDSRREALLLLEWMTHGKLGKELAPFFSQMPFLPACPTFDRMKASLRSLGVDFDSVISTQGTQEGTWRGSNGSENGSESVDKINVGSSGARGQTALKHRLEMVCTLLANENTGIRRVVLQHVSDLLRANRALFQALVENEGDTSMKHYLTDAYKGTSGRNRVETLLRCDL